MAPLAPQSQKLHGQRVAHTRMHAHTRAAGTRHPQCRHEAFGLKTSSQPQPTARSPQHTTYCPQPTHLGRGPKIELTYSPQPTVHSPQPTAHSTQPASCIAPPALHTAHRPPTSGVGRKMSSSMRPQVGLKPSLASSAVMRTATTWRSGCLWGVLSMSKWSEPWEQMRNVALLSTLFEIVGCFAQMGSGHGVQDLLAQHASSCVQLICGLLAL